MPKKTVKTTVDYLINAALPAATDSYTVVSHGDVISKTKQLLENKGYSIEKELYRCNEGAKVATGIYHLINNKDSDMGLLFAWSNSYDKTQKFRCSIGGYVHNSLSSVIGNNMGTFGRKHTGDADVEVMNTITEQIENADVYFDQLIKDKEIMKQLIFTPEQRAELMGKLYFIHEVLTGEQLKICRVEFDKPSFQYASPEDSVWTMYNAIIYSLQIAHPRTWMDQQRLVHFIVCNACNIDNPLLQPEEPVLIDENSNQLNLINMIEEIENEIQPELSDKETESLIEDENILNEIQVSKAELNHELHEVDNDNIEVTLSEKHDQDLITEETEEGDDTWECMGCGKLQSFLEIFHDGQLCDDCNNVKL